MHASSHTVPIPPKRARVTFFQADLRLKTDLPGLSFQTSASCSHRRRPGLSTKQQQRWRWILMAGMGRNTKSFKVSYVHFSPQCIALSMELKAEAGKTLGPSSLYISSLWQEVTPGLVKTKSFRFEDKFKSTNLERTLDNSLGTSVRHKPKSGGHTCPQRCF